MKQYEQTRDDFGIHTFLANVAFAVGDQEECERQLKTAQIYFHQSDNYTDYIDDIMFYIALHMKMERYYQTVEILDYYMAKCEKDKAAFYLYSQFLMKRIKCAKILHDHEGFEEYTELFMEYYRNNDVYNMESVLQAETAHKERRCMRLAQEEISAKNAELLIKSNHDTLTGLPNRSYWHSYAETVLAKAIKEEHYVGVEILDVDNFKSINDSLGHMEGDRYLVEVANVLYSVMQRHEGVFAGRYGGDEFVIVYDGKNEEEVIACMKDLKESVHKIPLAEKSPLGVNYVTLSQGCCHKKPLAVNRLWDFLAAADRMLYEVKRGTKDDFILGDFS